MTNWAPDATSIWGRCTSLAPLSRQWEVAGCSIVGYPPSAHHIRLLQQTSYIHLQTENSACNCQSSLVWVSSTSGLICFQQAEARVTFFSDLVLNWKKKHEASSHFYFIFLFSHNFNVLLNFNIYEEFLRHVVNLPNTAGRGPVALIKSWPWTFLQIMDALNFCFIRVISVLEQLILQWRGSDFNEGLYELSFMIRRTGWWWDETQPSISEVVKLSQNFVTRICVHEQKLSIIFATVSTTLNEKFMYIKC